MYCTNCGNKVDENAYICVNCGKILGNNNVSNYSRVARKKNKNSSITGIFSIITGSLAVILALCCYFVDISEVGMYTEIYERVFYAIGFTLFAIIPTLISFILALINIKKKSNKIGIVLSLMALFLILGEFFVVVIY